MSKGFEIRREYDANDRLAEERYIDKRNGIDCRMCNIYNSRGNITHVTNALGELVQKLSYNLQYLPIMQKDAFGNITEITYGRDGQAREVRRFGNGSWGSSPRSGAMAGQNTPEYYSTSDIDETQNSMITVGSAKNAAVSRSSQSNKRIIQQYEYNARGQIIGIIDGNGNVVQYR